MHLHFVGTYYAAELWSGRVVAKPTVDGSDT